MIQDSESNPETLDKPEYEGHTFRLGDFEGPLDLLLYLIKRTK